jgi:hypothetical protein
MALLLVLSLASPAQAGDAADFEAQLGDALGQYRDAFAHSGPSLPDPAAAKEALSAFTAAWKKLSDRWAGHPPPHYSEDSAFASELADISTIAAQASAQAKAGVLEQAHASLGQIRALLAEMRRRNGLHGFADEMDAFDDRLAEEGDSLFDDPQLPPEQTVQLLEQTAVLAYLGERIQKQSPTALADDANFLEMTEELNRQIRALQGLIAAGQRDPIVASLKDMRRHFDKLWLLYGA